MAISAGGRSVLDASGEVRHSRARIALVLSGGGLRGAAHVGVLQRLASHDIPVEIIVGSSAGAIIGAYYSAVGLTLDQLIDDAARFRGRHLLAHSMNIRLQHRLDRMLRPRSGLIPERLAQLDRATFERLHHGVRMIGVVCQDATTRQPCYFATGRTRGARLGDVVRASASIPYLFPPIAVQCEGTSLRLTDGGVSDCLPIAFARRPPLSATHVIVSDCRWFPGPAPRLADDLVYIRPRLLSTGTLWSPSSTLVAAVAQGAAAVTDGMLDRIRRWRDGAASGRAERRIS